MGLKRKEKGTGKEDIRENQRKKGHFDTKKE